MGGPFMWTRAANSNLINLSGDAEAPSTQWHARHDGYRRLSLAAIHDRRVVLDRRGETLLITDTLQSSSEHDCRLAFHLGPEVA